MKENSHSLNSYNSYCFDYKHRDGINLSNYVLFIENENQVEIATYIKNNYTKIKEQFNSKEKRFILLSAIDLDINLTSHIKYLYPRLNNHSNVEKLSFTDIEKSIGYRGAIKNGLLSIDSESEFIQFESSNVNEFKELIINFLSTVYIDEYDEWPLFGNFNSDADITLDDETKESVNAILEQLQVLKDKGNLLQVLPIVESYLKTQNTASIDELSPLKIDDNYAMFLTDYNLEIKMSHLTKSIYLLFLNHPEGILLSELEDYKKELLEYYKNVSNREDLDKMQLSIEDVVNTKTNAIYVHLSRIKSMFTKAIHPSIAEHYIIDGGKSKPKKIDLKSSLIKRDITLVNPTKIDSNKNSAVAYNSSVVDAFKNITEDE